MKNRQRSSKISCIRQTRASQDPSAGFSTGFWVGEGGQFWSRTIGYCSRERKAIVLENNRLLFSIVLLVKFQGGTARFGGGQSKISAWGEDPPPKENPAQLCPNWPKFNRSHSYHTKNNPWKFHQNHIIFDRVVVLTRYLGQFGPIRARLGKFLTKLARIQ